MKLFIINCSRQTHTFNYKLPEKMQSFGITIQSGKQHKIEQPPEVIECIIRQHEPYGLQQKNKVGENFSGICYSTEDAASSSEIIGNSEQLQELKDDQSQAILVASAATLNSQVENAVIQGGEKPKADGITMEITGEAINQDQDNPEKVSKTVKVQK